MHVKSQKIKVWSVSGGPKDTPELFDNLDVALRFVRSVARNRGEKSINIESLDMSESEYIEATETE
jgi:hypothetical protein